MFSQFKYNIFLQDDKELATFQQSRLVLLVSLSLKGCHFILATILVINTRVLDFPNRLFQVSVAIQKLHTYSNLKPNLVSTHRSYINFT